MNQDAGYTLAIQLKNIKRMESCKVTKSPDCKNRNTLYLQCEDVDNCTFERIKMEVGKSILRNSTLENCSLAFKDSLKLENCTMIRSDYTVLNNYEHHPYNSAFFIVPKQDGELVLDRCKIKMLDTKVPFFSNWQHADTASSLILKDTVVEPSGVLNTGLFGTMNGKPTKAAKAE